LEKEQVKAHQEPIELEADKPVKIRIEDLNQLRSQLSTRLDHAGERTKQLILRSLNTRFTK
jgi:hypothetical protein